MAGKPPAGTGQPLLGDAHAAVAAQGAAARTVVVLRAIDEPSAPGIFNFFLELEILLARRGFFLGLAAAATGHKAGMRVPPAFQGFVASRDLGIQIAIGEVEIPICIFDVAHQIADADLEFDEPDIGVDPGDHHAVVLPRRAVCAGDLVVFGPAPLQQMLPGLEFEVHIPGAAEQVARLVVVVVDGVVAEGEGGAGWRFFRDFVFERVEILPQIAGAAAEEDVVQQPVVVLRVDRAIEHGVEIRQGRFHAVTRVGVDQRRTVDRARVRRSVEHGAAQVVQHFGMREADLHRLLERHVPILNLAVHPD